jgi:hypothetical protein
MDLQPVSVFTIMKETVAILGATSLVKSEFREEAKEAQPRRLTRLRQVSCLGTPPNLQLHLSRILVARLSNCSVTPTTSADDILVQYVDYGGQL